MSCPPSIVIRSGSDPAPNQGGGSTGAQGPRGYQGYQGFQGDCCPGPQGYQGFGYQGYQGVSGVGYQGPPGPPGQNGFDGEQGPQGTQGFQGPSGGGSGSQDLYNNSTPTSVTIGGIPSGSTFVDQTMQEMWDMLLYPYQNPAFSAFTMSGQSTTVEVGTTISGSKTFTWTTTNSGNIQANSLVIRDVTGSTNLATGLANDGSESVSVGSVQKTSATSNQWSITGTNTKSATFSSTFTVNWQWRLFYGTSTDITLDETGIEALSASMLTNTASRTYSYAGGGYKYLAFPTSFTAPSSFKDASNNLNIAMCDSSDDASYSGTANGLSFATVSVTNSLSQTTNYRVYRTKNILGGAINIVVA